MEVNQIDGDTALFSNLYPGLITYVSEQYL